MADTALLHPEAGATGAEPAPTGAVPATLLLAGDDPRALAARLDLWIAGCAGTGDRPSIGDVPDGGPARLAVVGVTDQRLELARRILAQGLPWRGRNGVWFEPRGLLGAGGRLAFLFPGVEASFAPRVDDVARHFGHERLLAPLHRSPGTGLSDLEQQCRGIIAVARLLVRVLGELGVRPDMVAGHSLGEWSGLLAAGLIDDDLVGDVVDRLRPGAVEVADVAYLALGCGAATASELIAGLGGTVVSHDNCPTQAIVCGPHGEIATVADRCRQRRVLAQELPFRSGFHSPSFAAHLPAVRAAFGALPFRTPALPLWSATTCRPFPADPDEARALAERHLVEPIRFRELALALHDAGARVFVQLGVGTLTGFVDDTLDGREAVTAAACTPRRSGLEQLAHLAAALWVEGHPVALDALTSPGEQVGALDPTTSGSAVPALDSPAAPATPGTPPAGPGTPAVPAVGVGAEAQVWRRRFGLDVEPAWADHALFRQRPGWPHPEDRFPIVPMSGIVEVLVESAAGLHPGLVPVAVEDVAAIRWLVVAPPTDATLRAVPVDRGTDGATRVKVTIDGHAWGTVVLAPDYPTPPPRARPAPLAGERPSHIDASRFYLDRHMFHGPAYQGVERFLAVADNGSRAVLRATPAPGALLDAASQLMGHWLSAHAAVDRVVFPTSIDRIELFGPHPPAGTPVDCTVTIGGVDDRSFRADIALVVDGTPWCRISGWEDRRFTTDSLVFETLLWPERSAMSVARGGYTLVAERWADSATRDLIMRRYLGRDERLEYERHHPLAQRRLLLARMAAKDAVRRWLWDRGHGPLYPAEIAVADDHARRPLARGPYTADLRVAVASVAGAALAVAGDGVDVGIDVEPVEPRVPDFERLALTPAERALDSPGGYGRDTWLTCLWAVKEAAARAAGRAGGLQGRPRDVEIAELRGTAARVGDRWIAFESIALPPPGRGGRSSPTGPGDREHPDRDRQGKEHIVAWTLTDR